MAFDPNNFSVPEFDPVLAGKKSGFSGGVTTFLTILASLILENLKSLGFVIPAELTVGVLAGGLAFLAAYGRNYLKFKGKWPKWLG